MKLGKSFILSVSYGDYTTGVGGIDKVVKTHNAMLNNVDISSMYIFPFYQINSKIRIHETNYWIMIFDGKYKGVFSTQRIIDHIYDMHINGWNMRGIFIHSLKNVVIEELKNILSITTSPLYFYLHDYMSVCPTAGLINSNGVFCGSSFPSSDKCSACQFYSQSVQDTVKEIKEFFRQHKNRMCFIAPSVAAKTEWLKCYSEYSDNVRVIYHQKTSDIYDGNKELISDNDKLKVAFVGYQKELKGWRYWHDAVKYAVDNGSGIEFYQFGRVKDHFDYIKEVQVDFQESLTAMTDELRRNKIHIAVLWSIWPETYAYTYYESWAANAFILCNRKGGNICDQAIIKGNGYVADTPDQLKDLLSDEKKLRLLVNQYRAGKKNEAPKCLIENDELYTLLATEDTEIQVVEKGEWCFDLRICGYAFLYRLNKLYQSMKKRGGKQQ